MIARARIALALTALLAGRAPGQTRAPGWTAFAGIRVGGPTDDVLAHDGECRPIQEAVDLDPRFHPEAVASFAFGFSLPHSNDPPQAIAAALSGFTVCRARVLEGRAVVMTLARDRIIVGINVIPTAKDTAGGAQFADSLRAALRREWGRPTAPAPTLDSWLGSRYRAYFLVPRFPRDREPQRFQIILVDVAACTAFERRVHARPGTGAAEDC